MRITQHANRSRNGIRNRLNTKPYWGEKTCDLCKNKAITEAVVIGRRNYVSTFFCGYHVRQSGDPALKKAAQQRAQENLKSVSQLQQDRLNAEHRLMSILTALELAGPLDVRGLIDQKVDCQNYIKRLDYRIQQKQQESQTKEVSA